MSTCAPSHERARPRCAARAATPAWNARAISPASRPRARSCDHGREQRAEVQLVVRERNGYGSTPAGQAVARQVLQPDRRLALEGHRAREAEQRGGRVEQPAHRRGREARTPCASSATRVVVARPGKSNGAARRSGESVQLREEPGRRLHRVARRRVAAHERRRPQVRRPARSPQRQLPTKISPPQIVPSSPYPVPSRLTPSTRVSHRSALGQHRGDVRAMMLDGVRAAPRRARARSVVERYCGWASCDDAELLQVDLVHRQQVADGLVEGRQRARSADRSPMCWLHERLSARPPA